MKEPRFAPPPPSRRGRGWMRCRSTPGAGHPRVPQASCSGPGATRMSLRSSARNLKEESGRGMIGRCRSCAAAAQVPDPRASQQVPLPRWAWEQEGAPPDPRVSRLSERNEKWEGRGSSRCHRLPVAAGCLVHHHEGSSGPRPGLSRPFGTERKSRCSPGVCLSRRYRQSPDRKLQNFGRVAARLRGWVLGFRV